MLKNRIPAIAAELEQATKEGLKAGAELIAEAARERVPVDSGRLRDAIHVDSKGAGVYVVAGDKEAFYGHMVEHGTSHSAPHPFLVPAFEERAAEVKKLAGAALRRGIAATALKTL